MLRVSISPPPRPTRHAPFRPYLRARHSALGEELLFFAGMSVSRTLPYGSPAEIADEIDYFVDCTDGGRGMFLFTSNVTGVEVPPDNLRAAYSYIKTIQPYRQGSAKPRVWPWGVAHPE